jgi:hypothetical protein
MRRFLPALLLLAACTAPVGSPGGAPSDLEPLPAPERAFDAALVRLRDVEKAEVPYVASGHIYYTKLDAEGRRVHCRRGIAPGSEEQVLLEAGAVGAGSLGAFELSPDQRWLAFSTRSAGDRYTLRFKDLQSGDLSPPIEGTDFGVAWDAKGTLYYAALDDDDRPSKVFAVQPGITTGRVKPRLVHEDKNHEVLVAPVDDEAALFVREGHGVLGYRLRGGRDIEGLPAPVPHEGARPLQGGTVPSAARPLPAAH